MAFITEEYVQALRNTKLTDPQDITTLHELTKEKSFRNGKGYSKEQIRNFLFRGHTCTDEMASLIMSYFSAKKEMQEKLKQQQKSFADKLKEEVA